MEIILNSGKRMPLIGLGTWKSAPNKVKEAVETAIDVGYRHIDCAYLYKNEQEVGTAINEKFNQNVIKREDIFITTKLWNTFHKPADVLPAFNASLNNLGLNYIDLYLIHFPCGYKNSGPNVYHPKDENGDHIYDDTDYMSTWKELEKLLSSGKVRSIGVSNFNEYQLNRILNEGSIVPAVNQVECHPYLCQDKMIEFCKSHSIAVVGYSPFGSQDRYWACPDETSLLDEPTIVGIAKRHGKTTAQVILRFNIQRGVTVIPKSVTPSRIESNFDIFNFTLNEEDMDSILKSNRNWRALDLVWDKKHKYYPFRDNYSE
uniref:aldo-keto reductase family 1 member B1-like n=1 Tax=Styela clava TaxID=7725 RepID=UPI00193A7F15|nr:aldo-keto reductase family 1 member B1-like [Styela clava]